MSRDRDIAEEFATEIGSKYDTHFKAALELIDKGEVGSFKLTSNVIDIAKQNSITVATLKVGQRTVQAIIKKSLQSRELPTRRNIINDTFLFNTDLYYHKKYGIVTHSIYDLDNRVLKIQMTKPIRNVGVIDMAMILTVKDTSNNKEELIVTNADDMSVSDIITIKKAVELRKKEWPDVPQDEIVAMVERQLMDKGVRLLAYDNYTIEY
ncbi:hypothetical protein [Methanolobus sp. WCC4]|uniref:hypothetical protein n=1 Tax=Methanolobus sp. WCC4 TaxID=3125784 RepID=UPI0030F6E120